MIQPSELIALAREVQQDLADSGLPPTFARLYSQYTRLKAGQPGLTSWRDNEFDNLLNETLRLVEAGFIQKEANDPNWRSGMRRVGELLEWLSLPDLNRDRLPLQLLSAAAYQLAGYPARASGLLTEVANEETESQILHALLKADFQNLLHLLTNYWGTNDSLNISSLTERASTEGDSFKIDLHYIIIREVASALGILCAEFRWGNERRLQRAISKLSSASKALLNNDNSYSWLLSKFCAEVAATYAGSSIRTYLLTITERVSEEGRRVLERYLRQKYIECKSLVWQSQMRGIESLASTESFALCTPTGSGKTTIAEIAILQSLFPLEQSETAPLAIYLVPSRALAAEVEAKLSRLLKKVNNNRQVIVTGLYGGSDWGPTDAWLTATDPTVLICTYEKAEALMRFLGAFFLRRVSLAIIDEAHMVQFAGSRISLQNSENRSLRLELLGARMFTFLEQRHSRIIALSAVASEMESALAHWISGQSGTEPVKVSYRSTRQLIGRLECQNGRFEIQYDLLDSATLRFTREQSDTPYIQNPFPVCPSIPRRFQIANVSEEMYLRPYLFWAAMHLATPDSRNRQRAVLISLMQGIDGYAKDFLDLLDRHWANVEKPQFFAIPINDKLEIWQKCLDSCEDYFGLESREYRLLQKGIIVHHGKMPGVMARLLIDLIDQRIIHLVLATSTLSEGVNLPFEIVLIPKLQRRDTDTNSNLCISIRDFSNLAGRAGRPGFGTEGRCLVLMRAGNQSRILQDYNRLIQALQEPSEGLQNPKSPLAELLLHLRERWSSISNSNSDADFINWLDQTAPLRVSTNEAIDSLDSLDSALLSMIVESEQIMAVELTPDDLEVRLQDIWQHSYAYYASNEQERLSGFLSRRGRAIKTTIYPNYSNRRQLYRTGLPPISGSRLLAIYPEIIDHLRTSEQYANWNSDERFNFIQQLAELLSSIPKFELRDPTYPRNATWRDVLRWWLDPNPQNFPSSTQVSKWHNHINQNFLYRFNWGFGSIISLAIDEASGGQLVEPTLETWSSVGLPWIAFWIKELITWGTLDPVAAYLLAKSREVITRPVARQQASIYYEQMENLSPNEKLNAVTIRDWTQQAFPYNSPDPTPSPPRNIPVTLLRNFSNSEISQWKVLPVEISNRLVWFDPAGFKLAESEKPAIWEKKYLDKYDFVLHSNRQIVESSPYL